MEKNFRLLLLALLALLPARATFAAPSSATASATLSIEDFTIAAGGTAEMLIDLSNADMQATLVQFDLRLPEGLAIATDASGEPDADIAGRTTWTKHNLMVRTVGGVTRFLLASGTNALISGTGGALISVKLTAAGDFISGVIKLERQLITAPDLTESKPEPYSYTVYLAEASLEVTVPEAGWGWVSTNLADDGLQDAKVFLAPVEEQLQRIVGHTQELVNDPEYGLVGNLAKLYPQNGYRLQTKAPIAHTWNGTPCIPSKHPVSIKKGWNWIGYIPVFPMLADEALDALHPTPGDIIFARDGSHLYGADGSWLPTLVMEPGKSYQYKAQQDGVLVYPDEQGTPVDALARRAASGPQQAPWHYSVYAHPDNMAVVCLPQRDGAAHEALSARDDLLSRYAIGAFCGDECRGLAKACDGLLFLTVHGTAGTGELISFRAYDTLTGEVVPIAETMVCDGDCHGTLTAPVLLTLSTPTGIATAASSHGAFDIYTIGGQRVRSQATSLQGLTPGIYIANGTKIVVK